MYIENLKNYRYQRDLTLQQVADYCGVSRQYICKWEKQNEVPDKFLKIISKLYELEVK